LKSGIPWKQTNVKFEICLLFHLNLSKEGGNTDKDFFLVIHEASGPPDKFLEPLPHKPGKMNIDAAQHIGQDQVFHGGGEFLISGQTRAVFPRHDVALLLHIFNDLVSVLLVEASNTLSLMILDAEQFEDWWFIFMVDVKIFVNFDLHRHHPDMLIISWLISCSMRLSAERRR